MSDLLKKIEAKIDESGISKAALASKMGITPQQLHGVLRKNSDIKLGVLTQIADAMNVSVDYLLSDNEKVEPVSVKDISFAQKAISILEEEIDELKKDKRFLQQIVERLTSGGGGVLVGKSKPVSESLLVA